MIRYRRSLLLLVFAVIMSWLESHTARAIDSSIRAEHVVIIGIDGMKGEAASHAQTPNLRRFMEHGAYTLHARAVIPLVSKPNWSAMIMGAPPEQTGVTSNEWGPNKGEITPVCTGLPRMFPTIFGLLKEQKPASSIGVFSDWDGFATLVEPNGQNVMETNEDQLKTTQQAVAFIRGRKPTLTFIHYDSVDEAGHAEGWDTLPYYEALGKVDGYIGEVTKTLDEVGILQQTVILVTADHGGKGRDHGQNNMANIEIPWIISGPGIKAGHEIADQVKTYDTTATIAYILQLSPPTCWLGRPVHEVFKSSH
jgi:predicted AlkP superfamily pyrophosphatase or phosphodiesterase